jgi:hypothetical protein
VATDEEIQNALLAIHSRLGTIEGKINLVARADRDDVIAVLEEAIKEKPLLGQVYLMLDGKRSQQQILEELRTFGIAPSQPTVSRRMDDMVSEYGIADVVSDSGSRVLRKNRAAEDILNLTRRVRRILEDSKQTIPEVPARKRNEKDAKGGSSR